MGSGTTGAAKQARDERWRKHGDETAMTSA